MTTLSQIYNKWLQKGNELDPETARENIASYLDSHIDKLADSMVEKSGGTVSKDKVIDDSYEILNTNSEALTDTMFMIFDKIKKEKGSSKAKSEDFDYYIDSDKLLNFKARFKAEYFDMAMEANAKIESGKSYTIQNDYGAYGKYQIMWANYIEWGKEAGIDVFGELNYMDKTLLEYYLKIFKSVNSYNKLRKYKDEAGTYNLNLKALDIIKKTSVVSKSNQEKIAKGKFYSYFLTKGDWALCVASWYCGPGEMTSPDKIKGLQIWRSKISRRNWSC